MGLECTNRKHFQWRLFSVLTDSELNFLLKNANLGHWKGTIMHGDKRQKIRRLSLSFFSFLSFVVFMQIEISFLKRIIFFRGLITITQVEGQT